MLRCEKKGLQVKHEKRNKNFPPECRIFFFMNSQNLLSTVNLGRILHFTLLPSMKANRERQDDLMTLVSNPCWNYMSCFLEIPS